MMDAAHLRRAFSSFATRGTDHQVMDFLCKKFYRTFFCDPVQYNYIFVSFFAVGLAATMCVRHLMLNPDVCVRHGQSRREFIDRWQLHLYSVPYYNHFLRNWSLHFSNSFVDNEPDYLGNHPWGLRPKRSLAYCRYPFTFMNPFRYFVDEPKYTERLHAAMEKRYEKMGYYPDRVKAAEDEAEKEEE